METFLKEALVFDDLFKRLKQMQSYLFDIKKLELFTLPKLVCLQNAYMMNMHYLNNKWLDIFPSLQTIEKFIEDEKNYFFYLNKMIIIIYIITYWLLIKIFKS